MNNPENNTKKGLKQTYTSNNIETTLNLVPKKRKATIIFQYGRLFFLNVVIKCLSFLYEALDYYRSFAISVSSLFGKYKWIQLENIQKVKKSN